MSGAKLTSNIPAMENMRRTLEARLSQEQCELLQKIRALRATIGPITKDVGSMLQELDETGTTDAA